jgi:hypothetical protein
MTTGTALGSTHSHCQRASCHFWRHAVGHYNPGVIYFLGRLWCALAHREMHHAYGSKRRICLRCLQATLA